MVDTGDPEDANAAPGESAGYSDAPPAPSLEEQVAELQRKVAEIEQTLARLSAHLPTPSAITPQDIEGFVKVRNVIFGHHELHSHWYGPGGPTPSITCGASQAVLPPLAEDGTQTTAGSGARRFSKLGQ
jgi:hypothetical protein